MHTDAVTGKALTASAKGGNMFKIHSDYKPTGTNQKQLLRLLRLCRLQRQYEMQNILY